MSQQTGIGGSGEAHWQTRWEVLHPEMRRFQSADWDKPDLADWLAALDRTVGASATPPLLVAHSLGCLLSLIGNRFHRLPLQALFLWRSRIRSPLHFLQRPPASRIRHYKGCASPL
ncbi:hypothetical protein RHE_CH00184 [Rhizobium etli CFN 42]|uniref:Uncharacterized protein n=1 Tax=Rhizobium etli (strain ATCC 51251 / DSM 11541 / JCM 21823 / NBRC 15573 / CFN 42) TaxID=347834 RepID=Q2KDS7_RHIEC|nr:hypothetical protein RHE_CH00184 [Rhizobium etli CFN 42]